MHLGKPGGEAEHNTNLQTSETYKPETEKPRCKG